MTVRFDVIVADQPLDSPFRGERTDERRVRVGLVQCAWDRDAARHERTLRNGVGRAATEGASIVLLQELTLSPYFCVDPDITDALDRYGEDLDDGPTATLARSLAAEHGIAVHASLYERCGDRGFNTAIVVDPAGTVLTRTRKTHIPAFAFYHEDRYFEPGDTGCPVTEIAGARFAFPTCWDQWFPELARVMALDGAEVIVYPTAIGSEPHRPGFDSRPMWQQMIAASGLANATFMVAINRIGTEGPLTFYGSSFVSDPYGRILAAAPSDRPAVLVADVDLGQREDWLDFGLISTRRPDAYGRLVEAVDRS